MELDCKALGGLMVGGMLWYDGWPVGWYCFCLQTYGKGGRKFPGVLGVKWIYSIFPY